MHESLPDTVSGEKTELSAEAASAVTTPAIDVPEGPSGGDSPATKPKPDMAMVRGVWARFLENALLVRKWPCGTL